MAVVQIPLTNQPNQYFSITLPGDETNITLDFVIIWNRVAGYWQANISQNGMELITGLPLLAGENVYTSLLYQFQYLNIGHLIVARLSSGANDSPGENDWESNFILLWGP